MAGVVLGGSVPSDIDHCEELSLENCATLMKFIDFPQRARLCAANLDFPRSTP